MSTARTTVRTAGVALRAMLLFTLVLGLGYTALITGIGQLVLPWQANGSTVQNSAGETVGSALLGQTWTDAEGTALPEYFQSRPSAAGDGYDGGASQRLEPGPRERGPRRARSRSGRQRSPTSTALRQARGPEGLPSRPTRSPPRVRGSIPTSAPSTPCFRSRASPRSAASPSPRCAPWSSSTSSSATSATWASPA